MPPTPGMPAVAMTMPLLPWWARLVWTVALAAAAMLHGWHAYRQAGQPGWWHGAHIAMAAGMAAMYAADPMNQTALAHILAALFAIITVAVAAATVVLRQRERVANPRWTLTALDAAAMTYMAAVVPAPTDAPGAVTWIVIAYLAFETLARLSGLRDRVPPPTRPVPAGLSGPDGISVRASLAVMTASMAYMLAAMTQ